MDFLKGIFSLIWLGTLIAFVVYWWKKRKAKKDVGENYTDDENYKKISKMKRIIGAVCIASFIIGFAIPETPKTPEEQVRIAFNRELDNFKSAMKEDKNISDFEFFGIDSIQFVSQDKAIVKFSFQYYVKNSTDGGKTFYKELSRHQEDFNFKKYGNTWKFVTVDDDGEWLTMDEMMKKYSK